MSRGGELASIVCDVVVSLSRPSPRSMTRDGGGRDTHTAPNIKEDPTDVLRVLQRLEGMQPFLDDDPEGVPFILEFPSANEPGIIGQTVGQLEGRVWA